MKRLKKILIKKMYRNYNVRIMTVKERNDFGDTTLSVSIYTNLTYSDQAEIFERIQNGEKMKKLLYYLVIYVYQELNN
jgi:hypothetical protein